MKKIGSVFYKYVVILVCCFIYSAGIALFLDPNDLAPGGVSGIAIILNRLIGIETGTIILFINVPILIIGFMKFGYKLLTSTVYAVLWITFFTNKLQMRGAVIHDKLLAALAGSFLCALAMAVIFRFHSTTGGSDIVVKLLRIRYPHLKTGTLFLLLDAVVIVCAGFAFGNLESVLYAGIAVMVHAVTLDFVLYGADEAKLFYIISEKTEQISDRLMHDLEVGVTHLKGSGAYHRKEKDIILCVVHKKTAPKVLECVKKVDCNAFMITCNATEIYGEGYKSYDSEHL